jgi:hypothetical protein
LTQFSKLIGYIYDDSKTLIKLKSSKDKGILAKRLAVVQEVIPLISYTERRPFYISVI